MGISIHPVCLPSRVSGMENRDSGQHALPSPYIMARCNGRTRPPLHARAIGGHLPCFASTLVRAVGGSGVAFAQGAPGDHLGIWDRDAATVGNRLRAKGEGGRVPPSAPRLYACAALGTVATDQEPGLIGCDGPISPTTLFGAPEQIKPHPVDCRPWWVRWPAPDIPREPPLGREPFVVLPMFAPNVTESTGLVDAPYAIMFGTGIRHSLGDFEWLEPVSPPSTVPA